MYLVDTMDIVERLRNLAAETDSIVMDRAADEIEHLRTINATEFSHLREQRNQLFAALEQIVYIEGINPTAYKVARAAITKAAGFEPWNN